MPALKNSRQEIYTQNWFEGKTKEESAIVAGYAPKWARSIGCRLSTNANILARYNELQQKAEDDSVAGVLERKQVLTEIVRGRFADFMTKLTPEKLQSAALQEIRITEIGRDIPVKHTTIKLNSPAQAIDLLNKMDKLYAEGFEPSGSNKGEGVTILNVINFDSKTVAAAILEAEQLGISAALLGSTGHGEDATVLSSSTDVQTTPVPEPEQ